MEESDDVDVLHRGAIKKNKKRPFKSLDKEAKLQRQREYGSDFRKKRRQSIVKKPLKSDPDSVKRRNNARQKYHTNKKLDAESVLENGRNHQKALRIRKGGGAVSILVSNAIKNVLRPFKRHDKLLERGKIDRARVKERIKTDPEFAVTARLRGRVKCWIKLNQGANQAGNTMAMVGSTSGDVLRKLQSQLDGRTGKIEIDHIFPLVSYNVSDATQQFNATHISNLQPLTSKENRNKSSKLPTKAMAAKVDRDKWPPGITEDVLPDIYDGWSTALRM